MKLFYLDARGPNSKGFPFSNELGPMLDPIPYLDGKGLSLMRQYWAVNPRVAKSGIYVDERGTKWPDLMHAGGFLNCFLAARILESFRNLNCTIRHATEIPIVEIGSKKLRLIPPPRYFIVQVANGIERDWAASSTPFDADSNPVLDPLNLKPAIAKLSTWNGQDIFSWSNMGNRLGLTLLCTERVVELAAKEKWTNVEFKPVATI
jgi:hypothetical protein